MSQFFLRLVNFLGGFLVSAFYKSKLIRIMVFDGTPKTEVLLTPRLASHGGIFLVSPNDPVIGRDLFLTGAFDISDHRKAFDFLVKHKITQKGGGVTLVDVGANIGAVSIPWLLEGMADKVLAVEPEPKNFSLLMASVYLNNLHNSFTGYQCAISEKKGFLPLNIHHGNEGGHFIGNSDEGTTVTVEARVFDDVFRDLKRENHIIKIDVEGHEGHVLAGATSALKTGVPIIMEFMPYAINRGSGFSKLKNHLLSGNYKNYIAIQHSMNPVILEESSITRLFDKLSKDEDPYAYVDLLVY